jgi:hypothetical protein
MVVFNNPNTILIYTISNYVRITYKMTLPLYKEYSEFVFMVNERNDFNLRRHQVVRTYRNGILAVLFTKDLRIGTNRTELLFFGLDFSQHNTFIQSQEVSQYFNKTIDKQAYRYANINFIQEGAETSIGIMSWTHMAVLKHPILQSAHTQHECNQ